MELRINDYVRTKYGINKIISNPNENKFNIDAFKKDGITLRCIRQKDVVKSSPQIIDLIEVGDYVNGYRVDFTNISEKLSYEDKCIGFYDGDGDINLFEEDIKSIVTHEQFENIEYRVEE